MAYFAARLSPILFWVTVLLSAAVLGLASLAWYDGHRWLAPLLAGGLLLLGLLRVRGYTVDGNTLRIHRPGWTKDVDLADLEGAEPAPGLLDRSVSLWTTRGMFGVVGLVRHRQVGRYRAYVTDQRRGVLLRFRAGRPLLLSPESPDRFLAALVHPEPRRPGDEGIGTLARPPPRLSIDTPQPLTDLASGRRTRVPYRHALRAMPG